MHTELKTGNIDNIISMLSKLPVARADDERIVFGDDSEDQKLYAETVKNADPLDRRQALIDYQLESSLKIYSLWTNIYGWALGDKRRSNIQGGRAAMTYRGATLEDCILLAYEKLTTQPSILTLHLNDKKLPAKLQGALKACASVVV